MIAMSLYKFVLSMSELDSFLTIFRVKSRCLFLWVIGSLKKGEIKFIKEWLVSFGGW